MANLKRDPEIVKLENQLMPSGHQEMGITAFDSPPPAYMGSEDAGAGTENIGDAVEMPRLDLMQALSPQVQAGDARPGDWFHTTGEENLGREVNFVVCNSSRAAILWRPRPVGGILARTSDMRTWQPSHAGWDVVLDNGKTVRWETKGSVAESGLLDWGSYDPDLPDSGPAATEYIQVLAYFPEHPTLIPAVISAFKRSGLRVGKRLNSALIGLKGRGKPVYAGLFKLSSKKKEGPRGTYLVPHFESIGWADETAYRIGKSVFEAYRNVDLSRAADEAGAVDEVPVVDGHEDSGVTY